MYFILVSDSFNLQALQETLFLPLMHIYAFPSAFIKALFHSVHQLGIRRIQKNSGPKNIEIVIDFNSS